MNAAKILICLKTFKFLEAKPTQKKVAKICQISERTVRQYWKDLKAKVYE